LRGGPIKSSSISASVGPSGSSLAIPLGLRSSSSNSSLPGVQCTLGGSAGYGCSRGRRSVRRAFLATVRSSMIWVLISSGESWDPDPIKLDIVSKVFLIY
jgi:hypothetical protein